MTRPLARVTPARIIALCALWITGAIVLPLLYIRVKHWGAYWSFSLEEALPSALVLFGPPSLLVVFWYRARRRNNGQGAV